MNLHCERRRESLSSSSVWRAPLYAMFNSIYIHNGAFSVLFPFASHTHSSRLFVVVAVVVRIFRPRNCDYFPVAFARAVAIG
jgi:hypothetical protein